MKTATVPAQITTVEDKIAGNLTLKQIVLLASPIFIDFAIYAILPRMLKLNAYKLALMLMTILVVSPSAIRVRNKILLEWAISIIKYNIRPRYYVYNKNTNYLRSEKLTKPTKKTITSETPVNAQTNAGNFLDISHEELLQLEHILINNQSNLSFATTKRGGLRVNISESK
jgi:hypothetical protein